MLCDSRQGAALSELNFTILMGLQLTDARQLPTPAYPLSQNLPPGKGYSKNDIIMSSSGRNHYQLQYIGNSVKGITRPHSSLLALRCCHIGGDSFLRSH